MSSPSYKLDPRFNELVVCCLHEFLQFNGRVCAFDVVIAFVVIVVFVVVVVNVDVVEVPSVFSASAADVLLAANRADASSAAKASCSAFSPAKQVFSCSCGGEGGKAFRN